MMRRRSGQPPARSEQVEGLEGGSGTELRMFVGLGGNLGDRLGTLRAAVRALDAGWVRGARVVAVSSVYETRPLGPSEGAFLNAVVELRGGVAPAVVLGRLLELEAVHGRERRKRWDARTLDLDLLLVLRATPEGGWRSVRQDDERVRVPHPEMTRRDFVLEPLRELVGDEPVVEGREAGAWLDGLPEGERTVLRRWDEGLRVDGAGGAGA